MKQYLWKDDASCLDMETNLYFDQYEENLDVRRVVDKMCLGCPVAKTCFANGISGKEWGVWGGVYLENGEISREFSKHRTKQEWGELWKTLTIESQ